METGLRRGLGFRGFAGIMENQMEHEMETGSGLSWEGKHGNYYVAHLKAACRTCIPLAKGRCLRSSRRQLSLQFGLRTLAQRLGCNDSSESHQPPNSVASGGFLF